MYSLLAFFLTVVVPVQAPGQKGLSDLVAGVERYFAQMKDFNSDFIQIDQNPLNRKRQASGHVYRMRPRMLRWEYKSPEEQFFISDGTFVYFDVPGDKQVNKEAVKDTFDDRMPLMFLLGRSDLRSEFT